MSVITKEKLLHLSKLCAIKIKNDEIEKFLNQLDEILKFVSQLKEINVENIEPLSHPIEDCYLEPKK
jgi:aspartyl-tRNA(Asn)/glutamyl-tRNA(Gln) amidotransferase subunit C